MAGPTDRARALLVLATLACSSLSVAALAQSAGSLAPDAKTQHALDNDMADTVQDPRITAAQKSGTGTWKWAVPPVKMNGAFDDHDPIGLVAGKLIPADCSINWISPDTHKLYCFTSATSLVYFLDAPQNYLAQAEKSWQTLKGKPAS
ncbi:MAG: hypothetical protein P4L68_12450 [Methylovirgula sp.]|nr:hypothetical protein [Methylovirgula sp.]